MSSLRPAGPYRQPAAAENNRPFSIRDQLGAPGAPSQGEMNPKFPYGGVTRNFTHESAYAEPVEIFNRAFIAFFDKLDPLLQQVLPVFPFDGEAVTVNEFISKVRPFGPHGHQGPHETFGMQTTQQKFQMQWMGLMFALDNSILNTPLETFLVDAHTRTLQACMNMTVFIEVIENIVSQPNIFYREFELHTRINANPIGEAEAAERVVNMMEILPGIMDRGDTFENAMGYFLEYSGNMLDAFKVSPGLHPNFILMATWFANTLKTYNENVDSKLSESHIQHYMKQALNRDDIIWNVHPLAVQRFNGLSVLKVDAYNSTEGRKDPLERIWVSGECWVVRPSEMYRYQIIDYEKKAWSTVFEHGSEALRRTIINHGTVAWGGVGVFPVTKYNTAARVFDTEDGFVLDGTVPVAIMIIRPNVANQMQMIVHGIGGVETGVTAIGREVHNNYMVPQIDRREWVASMRLGIFVMHEEHFMILPNAKHQKYLRGGSAESSIMGDGLFGNPANFPVIAGQNEAHAWAAAPASRNAYYGASGLVGPNTRKTFGAAKNDVFMYWIPFGSETKAEEARMICSGGHFARETHLQDSSFNWLPARHSTNLVPRSGAPKFPIQEHGLNGHLNQICWKAPGRYFPSDGKLSEPIYTGDGCGPWRGSGLGGRDMFDNLPRKRLGVK